MKHAAVFFLWIASIALAQKSAANQPNILFISIDDLRPEIAAYGSTQAITPNLDRFASQSTRFDRAYVTYPLCLPSRASMLIGLRINYSGADQKRSFDDLIKRQETWPSTLKNAGYWTATVGKVYHGSVPDSELGAWDEPGGVWHKGVVDWSKDRKGRVVAEGGDAKDLATIHRGDRIGGGGLLVWQSIEGNDEILNDGQSARKAIDYLKRRPKDKPFLICVGFNRPHLPWLSPKKYFDLYPKDAGALAFVPQDADRQLPKEDQGSGVSDNNAQWNEGISDQKAKQLIRGYLASVSYVDAQVGRVLRALKETGQAENTIVVIWGDHGYHLTDHGLWRKNTHYHVANRSPLLIRIPGQSPAVCKRLVEAIDLYPTLLDLSGTKAPSLNLSGRSLRPLLYQHDAPWNHDAFFHTGKYYGAVSEQYRYAFSENQPEKLFDLKNDPHEWKNLADDPAHIDVLNAMRAKTQAAWNVNTHDGLSNANNTLLVFADNFEREMPTNGPTEIGNGWSTNSPEHGKDIKQAVLINGQLHVTRASKNLPKRARPIATISRDIDLNNGTIELRFRLPQQGKLGIGLIDPELTSPHMGLICAARITTNRLMLGDEKTGAHNRIIRKRLKSGTTTDEQDQLLKTKRKIYKLDLNTNQWHNLKLSIYNDRIWVEINGQQVGSLKSDGIAHPTKRRVRLGVTSSAVIDDFKIWASPNTQAPDSSTTANERATKHPG